MPGNLSYNSDAFVSYPCPALHPGASEAKPVFIPIQSLLIFPHECQESSFLRPHIVNSGSDVRPLQEKEAASHLACLIIRGTNADRACERAGERWSWLQISIGDSVFRPEIPAAFLPRRDRVLRLSVPLSLPEGAPTERASSSPCGYNLSASRSSRHVSRVSSPVAVVLHPNSKARQRKGRSKKRTQADRTAGRSAPEFQTPSKKKRI